MKRTDFYIIGITLATALIFAALLQISRNSGNEVYAEIYVSGEWIHRVSLRSGHDDILIENAEGGYNLIVFQEGAVFVSEANCRSQTCVRMGKNSRPGQVIACLPNRVLIRLTGFEEGGVDAIAH